MGGGCELGRRVDESNERHNRIATRRGSLLLPVFQRALADAKKFRRIALTESLLLTPRLERTSKFTGSHPLGKFHGHGGELRS